MALDQLGNQRLVVPAGTGGGERGLTLLVAGTESGPELSETKASVVLDVRRSDEGPLVVSPAVLQDGRELQVRRIGLLHRAIPHGLFHWGPGPALPQH